MDIGSKAPRTSRAHHAAVSALLVAVVLAISLLPLAGAQADTTTPTTTPKSDATPSKDKTSDAPGDTPPSTTTTLPPTTTTLPPAPPIPDTSPVALPLADNDGVDVAIENAAPHAGDGNQDGILDSEQANVASLPAAIDVDGNGQLDDYVTVVAPEGTSLENVVALPVPTDPAPPEDAVFHYGLFDYEVKVANAGDPADVQRGDRPV